MAKKIWREELHNYDVIFALDNIAAQQSLIKGSSRSSHLTALVRCHLLEDRGNTFKAWSTWVPSESNVAVAPSRLDCVELTKRGSRKVNVGSEFWNEIIADSSDTCCKHSCKAGVS